VYCVATLVFVVAHLQQRDRTTARSASFFARRFRFSLTVRRLLLLLLLQS
jgi:hypothetical protein